MVGMLVGTVQARWPALSQSHGIEVFCRLKSWHPCVGQEKVHQLVIPTYLRRSFGRSSSRAGTPLASSDACSLAQPTGQPLFWEQVPTGAGHTVGVR